MLKWILIAALKHCEQEKLLEIVERKLSLKSLNVDVGQRIYWLAAGMLSSSSSFTQPLANALSGRGSEQRIRHLANFLGDEIGGDLRAEIAGLDLPAKRVLISFIGKSYSPEARRSEIDATNFLETLINQVSFSCSLEASEMLNGLLQDPLLKS